MPGVRTAANALPRRGFAAFRRPVRRPLDEGVIEFGGEVILARDARPERDPGLILRVAAASATTGLPMAASTLARLGQTAPELRTPWPRQALKDLLVMLAAGPSAVATIEALDRTGLWGRLFPEWGAVRDLPPRDVVHIWTVDRHLVETVSRASAFTTRVSRPDLLLLGRALPRHRQGQGRGPQRHRGRTRHADRHPARSVAFGHRIAFQGRAPPPAPAAHRNPSRSAGREDDRSGRRSTGRRHSPAGVAPCAGRGRLVGDRPRCMGRLEGVADRRPGTALPAGDGRRRAAAPRSR